MQAKEKKYIYWKALTMSNNNQPPKTNKPKRTAQSAEEAPRAIEGYLVPRPPPQAQYQKKRGYLVPPPPPRSPHVSPAAPQQGPLSSDTPAQQPPPSPSVKPASSPEGGKKR